ncbi:MAG: DUF3108 domain-containing protein [Flavobacteriales bacterium]
MRKNSEIKKIMNYPATISIMVAGFFVHSKAQCYLDKIPFKPGEELNYVVYYNMKNLWVPAGKATFSVSDTTYEGKKSYHFIGKGVTFKEYDWFFPVRDRYESICNTTTLMPYRFIRNVHEGNTKIFHDYKFDEVKGKYYAATDIKNPEKRETYLYPKCGVDVMTAIYYARSIDFNKYKVNDTIPLTLVLDQKTYNVYIRYTGKAKANDLKKNKYNCIKFKPLLIEGTIFKDGEDMEVFVTDDENKIPVFIEAKILVGSIKVYLETTKGLKHEQKALITKK